MRLLPHLLAMKNWCVRNLWRFLSMCLSNSVPPSFRAFIAVLVSALILPAADSVRCFCDARSCDDALCTGSWCLVGFQSDVRLVQNCGTFSAHALKDCRLNWGQWDEVCSCQDDFCNTFSYLRAKVKPLRERKETATFTRVDPNVKEGPAFVSGVDRDTSNPRRMDGSEDDREENLPHPGAKNQLVLLLVVIPLGVGAMAVCLVFVNYHCKMC